MEQMQNIEQLAEDYGKSWIGSDIAWAAAQSGFIAGWNAHQQLLQQTPGCTLFFSVIKNKLKKVVSIFGGTK